MEEKPSIVPQAHLHPTQPHTGTAYFYFPSFHMRKFKSTLPQRPLLSAQVDWKARFTTPPENGLKEQRYRGMVSTVETKEQTASLGHENKPGEPLLISA